MLQTLDLMYNEEPGLLHQFSKANDGVNSELEDKRMVVYCPQNYDTIYWFV
jgi:hypothetical protein